LAAIYEIVTPFAESSHLFYIKSRTFAPKIMLKTLAMDELLRFIAETPLWLLIIFFAVFTAMLITFLILLIQALRS